MTEKRFQIYTDMVEDTYSIIPPTLWQIKEQQQKYCDELNKLHDENVELKKELDEFKQPNCRKCMHYSADGVGAYCMCENGLLNRAWEMFPFEWDYTNAKNCKEYEE